MILGGDLFSLIAAQVLEKVGLDVIWVSCRQTQLTSYGRRLNEILSSHPKLQSYLNYCLSDPENLNADSSPNIRTIENASLLNFLDNGSAVDVRLKVGNKIERHRVKHLICTNRYFSLHKKLRVDYSPSDHGMVLNPTSISRCHLLGEVTFLYFEEEQIDIWVDQLNYFIKTMRSKSHRKSAPKFQSKKHYLNQIR